jgi:hypothetical protein
MPDLRELCLGAGVSAESKNKEIAKADSFYSKFEDAH